jgi:Xaa-Pro aminopeptidase
MNPPIAERVRGLARELRKLDLKAMLVTNPVDVGYLSGFTGDDSWLLVEGRALWLITDSRFTEQAEKECPGVTVVTRRRTLIEAATDLARKNRIRRLGFDPAHVVCRLHANLAKAMKRVRFVEAEGLAAKLRMRKDPGERRAIAEAIRVAEEAWAKWRKAVRIGMTERRMAAELDHRMRLAGAEGPAFETIVGIDASGSMPHHRPGDVRLKRGSVVVVDFGARVGGYVSDLTRVVFAGKIAPFAREVYNVVLEAQRAGIAAVKAGRRLKDVDAAARKVIEAAGHGKEFGHGTGHGLGRQVHEAPNMGPLSGNGRLAAGMVVTVEPGIYLRDRFGIRIEDDVLVTATGRRVLSSLEKDIEAMVL